MTPFPAFNRQARCRHGTMLYNANDTIIGRSLDLYGEYSEGEVDVFRSLLKPGDIVVEAGANIGVHTVFLAQTVGPTGRVIAFEPQRVLFQTLCANLALNHLTNVYCWGMAVGARHGSVFVPILDYTKENNFGGMELANVSQGEAVPVTTTDSLHLPSCALLKIDVEGMEQAVIEGAAATIERFRPWLYVENDREKAAAGLIKTIDSLGYAMFWHMPRLYNPNNYFANSGNVFGNTVSINMLCCPKDRVQQVQGLRPVQVP